MRALTIAGLVLGLTYGGGWSIVVARQNTLIGESGHSRFAFDGHSSFRSP